MLIMAPMGPGTYGSQVGRPKKKKKGMSTGPVKMKTSSTRMRKGTANVTSSVNDQVRKKKERSSKARTDSFPTGQLKLNMKKMPPAVQKRLKAAMRKKK